MTILKWFAMDLDADDGRVRQVIDWDAQKCYHDWKSDLKESFDDMGGAKNRTFVRANCRKNDTEAQRNFKKIFRNVSNLCCHTQ